IVAQQCSGAPNENPTFLKPIAIPIPRFRTLPVDGGLGGRVHEPSTVFQPASSAHFSTTCGIDTPFGSGDPTERIDPSRTTLRIRISTVSSPNASASLFICPSAQNAPCGPPNPRNAPPGMLLVYTAYESTATFGISYGPVQVKVALPSTLVEV